MKTRIPPQITRIIALTILIVVSYLVARHFLVPESFGQYGHYRGAALQERRDLPMSYAGKKACTECHEDQVAVISKGHHKNLSCEVCHGPAVAHVENPLEGVKKPEGNGMCMRCHLATPVKPAGFPQINPAEHHGENCRECHKPHQPGEGPVT